MSVNVCIELIDVLPRLTIVRIGHYYMIWAAVVVVGPRGGRSGPGRAACDGGRDRGEYTVGD